VRRERLLEDDPVNVRIVAQRPQPRAKFVFIGLGGKRIDHDLDARSRTGAFEAAHVGDAGRVAADDCDGQARYDPARAQPFGSHGNFFAQVGSERASVEQSGRHRLARSDR
jgi:hypothetical protein